MNTVEYWLPIEPVPMPVSGKDGSDAKSYQEKAVREAIQEVQQKQGDD